MLHMPDTTGFCKGGLVGNSVSPGGFGGEPSRPAGVFHIIFLPVCSLFVQESFCVLCF